MSEKSGQLVGGIRAIAPACARYRWAVAALWLFGTLAVVLLARETGDRISADIGVPGSDSARALDLAGEVLPGGKLNDTSFVVLHSRRGTLDDQQIRDHITAMTSELAALPGVVVAADPFNPAGPMVLGTDPVSSDRRTGITSVILEGSALEPDRAAARRIIDTARAYDGPDLQVEVAGPGATALNATTVSPGPLVAAVVAALLVLGVTLRSRIAVAVCAAVTGTATIGAIAVTMLLSHIVTTTPFALMLAGVIAAGTSLGGAVVVVHRAQSSLRSGASPVDAASEAAGRSGVAVAAGSLGVTVAMAGVTKLGLSFFDAVAPGAAAAGAATGLVMLTLLPALLSLGGSRLLGWAERQHVMTTGAGLRQRPGLRTWWARQVGRQPVAAVAGGTLVLFAFALSAVTLNLGGADDGVDPTSMSTRRAYDLISAQFFPGLNGPMVVILDRGDAEAGATAADVVTAFEKTPGVASAAVGIEDADKGIAMIRVLPEAGPRSPEAVDLLHRLREDVVPTLVAGTGARAYVGGATAIFVDMAADFQGATTVFLGMVLLVVGGLGYLLLGSVTVAAVLAATTVLSAIAAAGQIALLFQTEVFARALGLETGPVEPFVLVLVLVSVICLSPGLNLSLLVRLAERRSGPDGTRRRRRRRDDSGLIERGHAEVGHVVLTMNLATLFIFAAIAAQPSRTMKVIGVGLATGVALDAFVLRATVLPALLHLLRPRRPAPTTDQPGRRRRRTGLPRPTPDLASSPMRVSDPMHLRHRIEVPDSIEVAATAVRARRPAPEVERRARIDRAGGRSRREPGA